MTQTSFKVGALVCSGCSNKIPQTGWLKQQKFISYCAGGWEVQDQVTGRLSVCLEPACWLSEGHHLAVCFCTFCGGCSWGPQALTSLALFIRARIPSRELHLHDLI